MNVSQASKIWLDYHHAHSKKNTGRAYEFTIARFNQNYANLNLNDVSTDDILDFMAQINEGRKPQTKRIRFAHLTAFFNFLRNNFDGDLKNPCDSPMLRKLFRPTVRVGWTILKTGPVDDDITNILRPLIFPTLLAVHAVFSIEVILVANNIRRLI